MTFEDGQHDESLAQLRTHDVSQRHARRLRTQCHAVLQSQPSRTAPAVRKSGMLFRRVIGPALAGAWCLAYLVEILRRAAGVYGL